MSDGRPRRSSARIQQLGKRERLDQIVVGSEIQAADSIVDAVSRRQDQDWRLDVTLPQRLEDFEPTASRQHQIEDDEVEELGVRSIESVFSVDATTTS